MPAIAIRPCDSSSVPLLSAQIRFIIKLDAGTPRCSISNIAVRGVQSAVDAGTAEGAEPTCLSAAHHPKCSESL